MASHDPPNDGHVKGSRRPPRAEQPTDPDARRRPVVLDSGARGAARGRRGREARAVLGVAIAAVLATGAVAAGGWSIMTATQGNTPASRPPLWYPTPPPLDHGQSAVAPPPAPPASSPAVPSASPADQPGGR